MTSQKRNATMINFLCHGEPQLLQFLQWNAGWMSQDKMIQIQKILDTHSIDIFTIMESKRTYDKLTYRQFPGYTLHLLPRDRQVASWILTEVKEGLTSHCEIIRRMGSMQDICEKIRINVWKNQNPFKMYTHYNPSQIRPNFNLLNMSHKTIVLGDFNAHSTRWGYENRNTAGKEIEGILKGSPLELIYSDEDPVTYLFYIGTGTISDLLVVSSDISELIQLKIIDDPGSGYKPVITSITINSKFMKPKTPTKIL
nr:hypothetical transcript [Hymenolepis microstoma]